MGIWFRFFEDYEKSFLDPNRLGSYWKFGRLTLELQLLLNVACIKHTYTPRVWKLSEKFACLAATSPSDSARSWIRIQGPARIFLEESLDVITC